MCVGVAFEGMPLGDPPASPFGKWSSGSVQGRVLPTEARCVVWRWDGSFLCEGMLVSEDTYNDERICIEGDTIGIVVEGERRFCAFQSALFACYVRVWLCQKKRFAMKGFVLWEGGLS